MKRQVLAVLLVGLALTLIPSALANTGQKSTELAGPSAIIYMSHGRPIAIPLHKTYGAGATRPATSVPSALNPYQNTVRSHSTTQVWDYPGSCSLDRLGATFKANKITCSYRTHDLQFNIWSCLSTGGLRCQGPSCPANTCRINGKRIS